MGNRQADMARRTEALPGLGIGLVLWLTFCAVAITTRGVRWDEAFEHGQVLAGQVIYPSGHPLTVYVHNAFSLQTYLSGLVVWLFPNPMVLCGLRNILFVAATVIPVFLIAARLSGSALWGHLAAVLTLAGILLEFDGVYPTAVWPNTWTNGHIGHGYALLTIYFLIAGYWRGAFALVALMPAVHLGHWPPVAALAGAMAVHAWFLGGRDRLKRALPWLIPGVAICLAFWIVKTQFHVPLPTEGPYASSADPDPIWRAYTASDPHRAFPPGNAHVAVALAIVLAMGGVLHYGPKDPAWTWLAFFLAIVCALVYPLMAVHRVLGADMPFLLIGWMPYRLLNYAAPMALVFAVCGAAQATEKRGGAASGQGATLGFALVTALFMARLCFGGSPLAQRYVLAGEWVFFGLSGLVWAILWDDFLRREEACADPRLRRWFRAERHMWSCLAVCVFIGVARYHRFGGACLVAGCAAGYVVFPGVLRPFLARRLVSTITAALLGAALLLAIMETRRGIPHLPTPGFAQDVAAYLKAQGEPDAMVAARPDETLLQAYTGHPVLVEMATPSLMSYMPALGPSINMIYARVYGIQFAFLEAGAGQPAPWTETWRQRRRDEWRTLSETYGFRYVAAAAGLELDLPKALQSGGFTLYAVTAENSGL